MLIFSPVQGWASELKYLLGNTEQVRANRSDRVFFRTDPIRSRCFQIGPEPNRSDLQILRFASEQIRTDHIRSQNVRSDRICDRIGYFLRTEKLIIQNYCFKSVFFIIKFHKRIILLLISNYYVQKMTDNLLENQTSQIILITHTQILQIRRLIFITDLKNIFFEFNDNLKKFFESFPITGGGPISSKKLRNFTISSLILRVSISRNVPISLKCANVTKFFEDLYFKLCCGRHE